MLSFRASIAHIPRICTLRTFACDVQARLMCVMNKKSSRSGNKAHTFGEAVRAIRSKQDLTQAQLAERIRESADAPWISRVESDQKDISLKTALQIARALGTDLYLDRMKLTLPDEA